MREIPIDLVDPLAGFELQALLNWPNDEDARKTFHAVMAAGVSGYVEDNLAKRVEARAAKAGQVLSAADVEHHSRLAIDSLQQEVKQEYLDRNGGLSRVVRSGGLPGLSAHAQQAGAKYGQLWGSVVVILLALNRHHPEISPSLNRATRVLTESLKLNREATFADRDQRTTWPEWSGIAGFWAALRLLKIQLSTERPGETVDLHDYQHRFAVVTWGNWISDFLMTFKSTGAKASALAPENVIRLISDAPSAPPPIPPLTEVQLAWARGYSAHGVKY